MHGAAAVSNLHLHRTHSSPASFALGRQSPTTTTQITSNVRVLGDSLVGILHQNQRVTVMVEDTTSLW